MELGGIEPELIRAAIDANLPSLNLVLLQKLLACSDPGSLAGSSGFLANTVFAALAALTDALRSYQKSKQPDVNRLESLRAAADRAVNNQLFEGAECLDSFREHLVEFPDPETLISLSPEDMCALVKRMESDVADVPRKLEELISLVWTRNGKRAAPPTELTQQVALEVSAYICNLEGSNYSGIRDRCVHLAKSWQVAGVWKSFLAPSTRNYKIVGGVLGAKKLVHLENLYAGAVQFGLGGESDAGWRQKSGILRTFTKMVAAIDEAVFIQISIRATDWQAASLVGYSAIASLLDQYVSGSRLSSLRLFESVAVLDCELGTAEIIGTRKKSITQVHPLSKTWPPLLKQSLRAARLAGEPESAMTRCALAWSAVETLGLDDRLPEVARALTLQSLRHQVNETHLLLQYGVKTYEKQLLNRWAASGYQLRSTQAAIETAPAEEIARLEVRLRRNESVFDRLEEAVEKFEHDIAPDLRTIAAVIETDQRGYLKNLNSWCDLLQSRHARKEQGVAVDSLKRLKSRLTGLPQQELESWMLRFAASEKFDNWCSKTEMNFAEKLAHLEVARNMTIHSGVYSMSGDRQLAAAGLAIVDMLHEFLGNWYSVSSRKGIQSKRDMDPKDVVRELADRQVRVREAVKRAEVEAINFDKLTSPTYTPMARADR